MHNNNNKKKNIIAKQDFLGHFKLQTIRQQFTGSPYEEMDGKLYVDRTVL